jgi:hypothetical protein
MDINRSNYEIWFTDWLDGNLNSLQKEELSGFLDLNPDLKEELNDLTKISLSVPGYSFHSKEDLKKSPEEISVSQFEYLSAAYLENDLTETHKSEIAGIIEKDSEKKKIFELINKTRLTPPDIVFRNKKRLLKITPAQKIFRLSLIGLSAAAAVILIFVTYFSSPANINIINTKEAEVIAPLKELQNSLQENTKETVAVPVKNIISGLEKNKKALENIAHNSHVPVADPLLENKADTLTEYKNSGFSISMIHSFKFSGISQQTDNYTLTASNIVVKEAMSDEDEGRSKIGRYIAKTFREKILKEKTPADVPLKGYEIAEAGVTGINKLFGWEMALDKKNDENGNLKSVYFSSRMLKFNAPVKKSEPLP